jgi:hypothetical protein
MALVGAWIAERRVLFRGRDPPIVTGVVMGSKDMADTRSETSLTRLGRWPPECAIRTQS